MGKLKTRAAVLCATLFIVMMVIIPSVMASCSNTPQRPAWGYMYMGTMTIEVYGDIVSYFSSGCAAGAALAAVCRGCHRLIHPGVVRACEIICRVVGALPGIVLCGAFAIINADYTNKNSWLRNNCASHHRRLVDIYGKAWWIPPPIVLPPYTNARCGC